MAECYRKQGDAQAQRVYERIVREFPDRKNAVATATARLGTTGQANGNAGTISRQVWAGPNVGHQNGTVSPEGRYLSFMDQRELAVHDFVTGVDRRVTNRGAQSLDDAENSAISRDGTQVAYSWYNQAKFRYELRTTKLELGAA